MDKYWIWFSRINMIGSKIQNELLKQYKIPEKIWNLSKKELKKNKTLQEEYIEIILNNNYRTNLEKYEQYMKKNNIQMVTINDEDYPEKLKNIYDPPVALYIKGNKSIINNFSLAIIGSRICSNYGRDVAKQLAYNLSKENIIIISGLASGIDTCAHIGTIEAKQQTIAILGNGLDIMYPKENKKIAEEIVKTGGTIISEYIVGTKPEKVNFPARNRIISGLSNGVIVVEAMEKSGTFITVDFALEQGKNIYAVPRKHI